MLHFFPRWHRFDWGRFTDYSRRVIGAAQHCAYAEQTPTINVDHLIRAVNLVRAELYRPATMPTAPIAMAAPKPFSSEARDVIALAWKIKNRRWNRYLQFDHIEDALTEHRRRK